MFLSYCLLRFRKNRILLLITLYKIYIYSIRNLRANFMCSNVTVYSVKSPHTSICSAAITLNVHIF